MGINKTFESWYSMVMENELATTTTSTAAPTISNDVDTIITSLETLARELTEELSGEEFNELNEAGTEGPNKVIQWMWWMPKARKAQAKVNKIKLNVTDMEAAAEDAPDKEQKAKITAKAKIAKEQASQLQKMVDDKFNAKGELVKKALHNEKIAGQIASIKRATGLEDNPEKVASYKEKMAELQQKYKEDQAAIKELEPSEEDKKAEKERLKQEKEKEIEKQKKLNADAEAAKNAKKTSTDSTDSTDTTDDNDSTVTEPATNPKVEKAKEEIKKYQDAVNDLNAKDKKTKDDENKISMLKQAIAAQQKIIDNSQQQESLVNRADAVGLNELAVEIASKLEWQVSEGTVLHSKYNETIKRAEYTNTLNESKYHNLSVKERFSKLI